ncbi:MAG: hypothetical protein ACREMA_06000 [Longimicrobiales bacterium]
MITWFVGNDNVLRLDDVRNEITGALITGATVSAKIVIQETGADLNGTGGFTNPFTLPGIAGKPGSYAGVCVKEANLVAGQPLIAQVTFTGGAGERAYIEEVITVSIRDD